MPIACLRPNMSFLVGNKKPTSTAMLIGLSPSLRMYKLFLGSGGHHYVINIRSFFTSGKGISIIFFADKPIFDPLGDDGNRENN